MNRSRLIRICVLALTLTAVMLVSPACGGSTTEKLREAAKPTSEPSPTPPPEPTAKPEAVQVVALGFGQDGQDLGFAFLIENPNAGLAVESSQYQVAAYDENESVVATDSGSIELILPNQKLGFAGTIWLDEGVTVSELEVQLKEGDAVKTEPIPTFTVDSISHYDSDYLTGATALISNPYNRDLKDLRVSAIAYNDAGEIVGGGFTYLNFILANGSTGVKVPVTTSGDFSKIVLYPSVSGLTLLGEKEELPEGTDDIALVKQGFGQSDRDIGLGMLIKNPNNNFSVEDSQYHATAFAEDGHVLTTKGRYVDVLLPEQTLGVSDELWVGEDMIVDRVEVQVKSGSFVESDPIPYFTAKNISYQADEYSPKVTGRIVSPYGKDITDLRVSAITYNEAKEIIGGGFTYLDFVPANGKSAVEVSVTSAKTPATMELYAVVSSLSEFD